MGRYLGSRCAEVLDTCLRWRVSAGGGGAYNLRDKKNIDCPGYMRVNECPRILSSLFTQQGQKSPLLSLSFPLPFSSEDTHSSLLFPFINTHFIPRLRDHHQRRIKSSGLHVRNARPSAHLPKQIARPAIGCDRWPPNGPSQSTISQTIPEPASSCMMMPSRNFRSVPSTEQV